MQRCLLVGCLLIVGFAATDCDGSFATITTPTVVHNDAAVDRSDASLDGHDAGDAFGGSAGSSAQQEGDALEDDASPDGAPDGDVVVVMDATSEAASNSGSALWCPPECTDGFECFEELGVGVCVALSNMAQYPGPCRSRSRYIGASPLLNEYGDPAFLHIERCAYTYDGEQRPFGSACYDYPVTATSALADCTVADEPADGVPCDFGEGNDGPQSKSRKLYYDDEGQLVRTSSWRNDGFDDTYCSQSVLEGDVVTYTGCPTSAMLPECDVQYLTCPAGEPSTITQGVPPLEPGFPWTPEADSPNTRHLYDEAGNLRYVVQRTLSEDGTLIELTEYGYDCWL